MHTSDHRFDHIAETLAQILRRHWTSLVLRGGDWMDALVTLLTARAPDDDAKIQWDDGEPRDKV